MEKALNTQRVIYNIINGTVIMISVLLFFYRFNDIEILLGQANVFQILLIVITVLIVNTIKAGRLYFALYGSNIPFRKFIKTFFKATSVNVVIPLKLGEFFRIYCYGNALNNMTKSIVIVLLDRFMDTAALVMIMIFVHLLYGGRSNILIYCLMLFLFFVLMVYLIFPQMYRFWNMYFLKTKASKRKIAILRSMSKWNDIYIEIQKVFQGRAIILLFMSVVSWLVEIGSAILQEAITTKSDTERIMSEYLLAALGRSQSEALRQFSVVSIIIMLMFYGVVKVFEIVSAKRIKN